MEPQKKLLMIVNPRAGRSKPRGPLYDAAAAFCDAGYLLSISRHCCGRGCPPHCGGGRRRV